MRPAAVRGSVLRAVRGLHGDGEVVGLDGGGRVGVSRRRGCAQEGARVLREPGRSVGPSVRSCLATEQQLGELMWERARPVRRESSGVVSESSAARERVPRELSG